jgi:hypothetical protein
MEGDFPTGQSPQWAVVPMEEEEEEEDFLNDFEMVPIAPIITGITVVFIFHVSSISTVRSLLLLLLLLLPSAVYLNAQDDDPINTTLSCQQPTMLKQLCGQFSADS